MSDNEIGNAQILQRLRIFLLLVSGLLCIGTIVELSLIEHWESWAQQLPLVLCGLGLIVVILVFIRPQHNTIRLLRWVMGIAFVGSLFGIYEHIEHNIGFALEIQPNATIGDVFLPALGGVNPLLAPGTLAFAAAIAIAATYYHPMLSKRQARQI